jgi:hypothetical protein
MLGMFEQSMGSSLGALDNRILKRVIKRCSLASHARQLGA